MKMKSLKKPFGILVLLLLLYLLGVISFHLLLNHLRTRADAQAIEVHAKICDNLVQAGQRKQAECVDFSAKPDEYIPLYFPVDESSKEFVQQGMEGIELLYDGHARCAKDEPIGSRLEYRLVGWEVTFGFCGNILRGLSYRD